MLVLTDGKDMVDLRFDLCRETGSMKSWNWTTESGLRSKYCCKLVEVVVATTMAMFPIEGLPSESEAEAAADVLPEPIRVRRCSSSLQWQ